jgi:hypothetical protein
MRGIGPPSEGGRMIDNGFRTTLSRLDWPTILVAGIATVIMTSGAGAMIATAVWLFGVLIGRCG